MRHLFNYPILESRRRALRKQPIPSEIRMWSVLRNRQFRGLKFRRQYSIGTYIVDFYCPKLHLAIEVDGDSHFWPGRPERDAERQHWLEKHGIYVVRFWSIDVMRNLDGVMMTLEKVIETLQDKQRHLPKLH